MFAPAGLEQALQMMESHPSDSHEHKIAEGYAIAMARRTLTALRTAEHRIGQLSESHNFVAWLMQQDAGAQLWQEYQDAKAATVDPKRSREKRGPYDRA